MIKNIAVLFLLLTSLSTNALLVDDFSTDQAELVDSTANATALTSSISGAGILGTERDLSVNLVDGGAAAGNASIKVDNSVFSFSTQSTGRGTGSVIWDGIDGSAAVDVDGLGSIDFTDTGASTQLLFTVVFADAAFDYQILTWWDSGASSNVADFTAAGTNVETLVSLDFTDAEFGSTDWSDISAFGIVIDPSGTFVALDVSADGISTGTIPEPTPLPLLGLGLLCLAARKIMI